MILDDTDTIGAEWCFPFVIFQGTLVTNLNKKNLEVLQSQADLKGKLRLNDEYWNLLLNKGEIPFK